MQYLILLTFALAPAYIIKLKLLGLPTNLLMLWVVFVWIVFAAWLVIKKQFRGYVNFKLGIDKNIASAVSLFLLAGIVSLFVGGVNRDKLGQFLVWFLQPISLYFIFGYIFQKYSNAKNLLLVTCYFLVAIAGLYAITQYFTLLGLPPAWWGNSNEPKRALSFFVHPNFYALWCAPLLALLIPDMMGQFTTLRQAQDRFSKFEFLKVWRPGLWIIGGAGLLLSLSRAGWLGLAAAITVFLSLAAEPKIRKIILGAVLAIAIGIIAVPNLRWRLILPFYGEKSAVSRISLWRDGWHAVKEAPLTGLGLTGFATHYGALNTDPNLDTHNFPHNVFLTFWTETGLLGLLSFFYLVWLYVYRGLKSKATIPLGISLFLITIIFQGLVDNPYFKNDLAMVFWIVLSLTF